MYRCMGVYGHLGAYRIGMCIYVWEGIDVWVVYGHIRLYRLGGVWLYGGV